MQLFPRCTITVILIYTLHMQHGRLQCRHKVFNEVSLGCWIALMQIINLGLADQNHVESFTGSHYKCTCSTSLFCHGDATTLKMIYVDPAHFLISLGVAIMTCFTVEAHQTVCPGFVHLCSFQAMGLIISVYCFIKLWRVLDMHIKDQLEYAIYELLVILLGMAVDFIWAI